MPKGHPFGPASRATDHGVMPPRRRTVTEPAPEPEPEETPPALGDQTVENLRVLAAEMNIEVPHRINKADLVALIETHLQ